jgi:rod shape determining protein RodA
MTLGLFPVAGVTFPFFSYGGSSMVSCLVAIGLVLNINMRKFK